MRLWQENWGEDGKMNFIFTKVFVATILFLIALLGAAFPLDLIIWGLALEVSTAISLIFAGTAFSLLIWAGRDITIGLLALSVYSHDSPTPPTTDANGWWQYWHAFQCYPPPCVWSIDA